VVEKNLPRLAQLIPLHVELCEQVRVIGYVQQRPEPNGTIVAAAAAHGAGGPPLVSDALDVATPPADRALGAPHALPEDLVTCLAYAADGLDVAEAQHVGLQLEVGEVEHLVGGVEALLSFVGIAGVGPVLVDVGPEQGALQRQQPPGVVLVVEDDLEAGVPVDAALHLGHEQGQVHVDLLVDFVDLLLDLAVIVGVLGLGDGLVSGCGGEEGVGGYALAYEFVLSEPAVVLVHTPIVGAGGGGAGLAVPLSLGNRCTP